MVQLSIEEVTKHYACRSCYNKQHPTINHVLLTSCCAFRSLIVPMIIMLAALDTNSLLIIAKV